MAVVSKLREVRTARGVGMTEIARGTGIPRSCLYEIEAQTLTPGIDNAFRLARFFNVKIEDMYAYIDDTAAA